MKYLPKFYWHSWQHMWNANWCATLVLNITELGYNPIYFKICNILYCNIFLNFSGKKYYWQVNQEQKVNHYLNIGTQWPTAGVLLIKVQSPLPLQNTLVAQGNTAVTPLLMHWSYCSFALSHRYHIPLKTVHWVTPCIPILLRRLISHVYHPNKPGTIRPGWIWYSIQHCSD